MFIIVLIINSNNSMEVFFMRSSFRSNTKRSMSFFVIILFVLLMGVGFAYLSQSLKINNTATIAMNAWNVHLENVVVRDGSVAATAPIIGNDKISVTASVTLSKPLDFYEYSVDVVNEGTLDAKLDTLIKTTLTEEQKKYLNYTITYKDHTEIKQNDLLAPGERETIRIVIEIKDVVDASVLPSGEVTINLSGQLNYVQDDGKGIKRNTNSLYEQIAKETQIDTSINFGAISSDTNGLGVYTLERTVNTANPVLYYRGAVENNNVIFGGFCWKIIRTTETGGIKMIYNGTPTDGMCNATGDATEIGKSAFNTENNDPKYVGYMYDDNTKDSTIKGVIDEWFSNNLVDYLSYLEDTPFYNERDYVEGEGYLISYSPRQRMWGNKMGQDYYAETVPNTTIKLGATEKNDIFTISGNMGNGTLTYPVGLLTSDEAVLAGARGWISDDNPGKNESYYLYTGLLYWTSSPNYVRVDGSTHMIYIHNTGYIGGTFVSDIGGVRPVVSLQPTTVFISGNGSSTTPYTITN